MRGEERRGEERGRMGWRKVGECERECWQLINSRDNKHTYTHKEGEK